MSSGGKNHKRKHFFQNGLLWIRKTVGFIIHKRLNFSVNPQNFIVYLPLPTAIHQHGNHRKTGLCSYHYRMNRFLLQQIPKGEIISKKSPFPITFCRTYSIKRKKNL